MRPRAMVAVLAAVVVLGAAGCGGSDGAGSSETATATPVPAPTAVSDADGVEPTVQADEATPMPQSTATPAPYAGPADTIMVTYLERASWQLPGEEVVAEYTAHRDGSYRVERFNGEDIQVYDAVSGVGASWYSGPDGDPFGSATSGVSIGGPDGSAYSPLTSAWWAVHAVLRGDAADPLVDVVDFLGRQSYRLEVDVVPNAIGGGPDHLVIIADADTGVPLRVQSFEGGEETELLEAQSIAVVEGRVGEFVLDVAPEDLGEPWDLGYQQVELADVAALVGYEPVVPAVLPEGYALSEVRVLAGSNGSVTGPEGGNPESTDVVQLLYTDGWRRLVVTTRRVGESRDYWADPFGGEGSVYDSELFRLTEGAFAFWAAETTASVEADPHLWAVGEELVLTITGPITVDTMVEMAQSMEPAD